MDISSVFIYIYIYTPSENKCTKIYKKRVLSIYVHTQCVFREKRGSPADRYFIQPIYFLNKFLAKLSLDVTRYTVKRTVGSRHRRKEP